MFTTISTIGVYIVVAARVKVITGPFQHYFARRVKDIKQYKEELFTELEPKGLEILEEEAPKNTGNFSKNFESKKDETRLWWFNLTETEDGILLDLILDNSAGGGDRTASSPGRYVPAIKKRLVNTELSARQQAYRQAKKEGLSGARAALTVPVKRVPWILEGGQYVPGLPMGEKKERAAVKKTGRRGLGIVFLPSGGQPPERGRSEKHIKRHEFGHAISYRSGRTEWQSSYSKPSMKKRREEERFAEAFAERAGQQKKDIGVHPGATRTPFYRRSYERIRDWAYEWLAERVGSGTR